MILPIGVGWFIVIVDVVTMALWVLGIWASFNFERRKIAEGELRLTVGKEILALRREIHDDQHRMLCKREETVSEQEKQLGSIADRNETLRRLEHDLGQAAHDMAMQTNMALHQTMDDTEISVPDWGDR